MVSDSDPMYAQESFRKSSDKDTRGANSILFLVRTVTANIFKSSSPTGSADSI